MPFRVTAYRDYHDKTRYVVEHSEVGLPADFFLAAFNADMKETSDTIRTYAYQQKYLLEYFESVGIDITYRVESGELFTESELSDFLHAVRYRVDHSLKQSPKVASFERFRERDLDLLIHATAHSEAKVASSTARLRLSVFIKVLEFVYENTHESGPRIPPKDLMVRFERLISGLKRERGSIKTSNDVVKGANEKVIPDDELIRLLEIIKPSHPDNPFSQINRLRNHIIILTLLETGDRRGELAGIKLSDINDNINPSLYINKTPDDPSDPRKHRPATKTRARESSLSKALMKEIKLYIDTDRARYAAGEMHDFLLVSHKGTSVGKPIATKTINYIFAELSKAVSFRVHPHLLRHAWNELFEVKARALGYDSQVINDMRKYACGWSDTSEMVSHYNQGNLARLVAGISAAEQSKLVPNL
ncbi:site-specific integrase [Ferrimonas balearica]|uniref:site-specific integrase n=1 Tax=Ferrimonas balearica TaxID=44012 RepID=UPI001C5750B5|nr:site-specific integrase [Ferrimonas balearica]MBW3139633.1 site-specific integrase [Ferrimonas balearica]